MLKNINNHFLERKTQKGKTIRNNYLSTKNF